MSLIEAIACVAIVGTLATSMVGMMRGSARVTAIAQGNEGAAAEGRQALRFLSERVREMTSTGLSIVSVGNRDIQVDDGLSVRRVRFEVRRASDGVDRSLVMVDPLLGETVCQGSSVRNFDMNEVIVAGRRVGIEMTLQLQTTSDRSQQLRPDQDTAEMATVVCLSPQL
ncbi:hypothetical protein [Rhodopirellula bahusiensis]|uniref:hypothetical protein n=1 Tax=Rhodopirellula bahusiensis TaxID=2014065 RepID=UPI0032637D43